MVYTNTHIHNRVGKELINLLIRMTGLCYVYVYPSIVCLSIYRWVHSLVQILDILIRISLIGLYLIKKLNEIHLLNKNSPPGNPRSACALPRVAVEGRGGGKHIFYFFKVAV